MQATAVAASSPLVAGMQRPAARATLRMSPGQPQARVVSIQSSHVVAETAIRLPVLAEMLQESLTRLTGTSTVQAAWRSILRPDDVIGLKFNRSGQRVIATTTPVAETVIASIVDAGWPPDRIVCIEAPAGLEARLGTRQARTGYDLNPTDFGSGTDNFASVLNQITALIDIPFLKTHNIAGLTCALKNLSHGLIKHPARYHANGCSPFIADIVASPKIRRKLRLCLVDALRVVFDGGPNVTGLNVVNEGNLLASFDPVAIDVVGLTRLNDIRRARGLEPIARLPEEIGYLAEAHRSGLGVAAWRGIDLTRLRL